MSNKTINTVYKIYGIVTSVLLIISGILLMISCVQIYNIGDRPFTVENISSAFSKISIPLYVTIAAVLGGFILWLIAPIAKAKNKAGIDKKTVLAKLEKRLDVSACDAETLNAISKEKKLRRILFATAAGLCAGFATPSLIYIFNFNNYGADYNRAVISSCLVMLPSVVFSMGICLAYIYLQNASVERQISAVKNAIAVSGTVKKADEALAPCNCKRTKIITSVRIALVAIALIFIVAGIFNGGMDDVLSKAINICTECIGLG